MVIAPVRRQLHPRCILSLVMNRLPSPPKKSNTHLAHVQPKTWLSNNEASALPRHLPGIKASTLPRHLPGIEASQLPELVPGRSLTGREHRSGPGGSARP